jgi:hypothetical protein
MQHTGMLFLSRHRPQAGRARCGAFQVLLQAYDRIDTHQTELWQITWTGPAAQRFWQQHERDLKPGAALQVTLERARLHTIFTRPPQSAVHARVISMEYVPRVQPAKPQLQPA